MGLPINEPKAAGHKAMRSRKKLLNKHASPRDDLDNINKHFSNSPMMSRDGNANNTSQKLIISHANVQIGVDLGTPKVRRSVQKRNSETEVGGVSPWSKEEHANQTYRTSKNSNQIWGSKKTIHQVLSPARTGAKEDDDPSFKGSPGKRELNLNLNERSAASIRDDATLLDDERSRAG